MTLKRLLRNAEAVSEVGGTAATKEVTPKQSPDLTVEMTDDIGVDTEAPETKEEEVKPVTQQPKLEEQKKETPVQKKEEQKKDEKPNMLGKLPAKQQRDYSGFTEEQQTYLKNMSNEAFNYIAPILRNAGKAPAPAAPAPEKHFFQHPDAYVLHPDFKRMNAEASYASTEAAAWMEQLVKIEEGEEWTPLTGFDPKTGKFVYGDKRRPTIQDKKAVRSAMLRCQQVEQGAKAQLQMLPQQFQQQTNNDLQAINQERAKRFDWVANPELLNFELDVDGVGKKKVADIRNDFISLFPDYQRATPGVEVAADLFVALNVYGQRLKAAEQNATVQQTLKEEQKRVEPTSSVRSKAVKNIHGISEFSLDGLPEI